MTQSTGAERPIRDPSLFDAVAPLMALALLIGGSLALLGLHALDGPITFQSRTSWQHSTLVGIAVLLGLIAVAWGVVFIASGLGSGQLRPRQGDLAPLPVFLPFLTALVYVIVRGKSMADRSVASARAARKQRTATRARTQKQSDREQRAEDSPNQRNAGPHRPSSGADDAQAHDAACVASSGQTTRRSRRSPGSSRPPTKRPIVALDHDPAMLPSIGILVGSSSGGARASDE